MCHNNNWHTLWSGSTFFNKPHTVSACHWTIFKCQPRQAVFSTVLEWPLCAVCCVFCFVSSLFNLRICFTFVFVIPTNWPGRGHFCGFPVITLTKPDIFFSRTSFVGHFVRRSGVLIVRQISTALLHTHTVYAILFVFMKIGEFSAQGLNFQKNVFMHTC